MTFLEKDPEGISNLFERWTKGIAPRGGSFMNLDCLIHDKHGNRILAQEWKWENEAPISGGQWLALRGLSEKPGVTVWYVRVMNDRQHMEWQDVADTQTQKQLITVKAYQDRFREWWFPGTPPKPAPTTPKTITSDMLRW